MSAGFDDVPEFMPGWTKGSENIQHYEALGMWKPTQFMAPADAPAVVDHRSWLWIENQGPMGSCAGHALATCAAVCNWIRTRGNAVRMSRMWCYLMGQQAGGFYGRDQGASISGCAAAARQYGICTEEAFPYPNPVQYSTRIPDGARDQAVQHVVRSASPMRNYADCYSFLAHGIGAIQIGIDWTEGLASNRSGIVDETNSGGRSYGGHSLAFVGYSGRMDTQGRNYLWKANSHGRSWGNQGFAEVAPVTVDRWIRSGSVGEFVGLSDMETYERRFAAAGSFA